MPSSISSSEKRRPVGRWLRTWGLAFVLFSGALVVTELTLRSLGIEVEQTDDDALWALSFLEADHNSWLWLGSSRTACAIDPSTFESMTGQPNQNLAITGGSVIPVVHLLNERGFAGKIIVELSPKISFAQDAETVEATTSAMQELNHQEHALFATQERRAKRLLQRNFRLFSPNSDLFDLIRMVISGRPTTAVGHTFGLDRQRICWITNIDNPAATTSHITEPTVLQRPPDADALLASFSSDLIDIQARGGTVLLWGPPLVGEFLDTHLSDWSDRLYFDVVAARTQSPAVQSIGHPQLHSIPIPDGEHIDPRDAPAYTAFLVAHFQAVGALPTATTQ